ncbi:FimD/PapC N-terminal domain-containing protein, partial [Burkholderia pseudomallei]|uniref:FimD/PapC N-terminal domain-containing protein n=1 Tax=Burkholderia pseudomallei TaxID=28450 RepID=UPI00406BFA9E
MLSCSRPHASPLIRCRLTESASSVRCRFFVFTGRGCYRVAQLPDARVTFDFTTQTLEMHIPQKGLQKKPLTTEWEYGHSALRVNYTANASHRRAGSSVAGVT